MNSGCRCKGRRSGKLWWCRGRRINQIGLPQEQVWGGGQDTGWKCIHEEGGEEKSADCREMISVLTPGTSITFSTATLTDPSQRLIYLSVPQQLEGKPLRTGTNHKPPAVTRIQTAVLKHGSAITLKPLTDDVNSHWSFCCENLEAFTWTLLCHVQSLIHGCSSSQPRGRKGSSINVPVSDTEGHPPEGLHPELFRCYKRDEYNRAVGLNAV